MPQASQKLRNRWKGPSDSFAIKFLKSRGFLLSRNFIWVRQAKCDKDEISAITFMIEEWDYGYTCTPKKYRREFGCLVCGRKLSEFTQKSIAAGLATCTQKCRETAEGKRDETS